MFRFPIGFMAALGLVLGAYCVSRSNAAEESSAPAKGGSAANAPAMQQKPAATASPAAAEPAGGVPLAASRREWELGKKFARWATANLRSQPCRASRWRC